MRTEAQRVFQEMEDDLNAVYTPEEQETLKQLLKKLHDRFNTQLPEDPMPHGFLYDKQGEGESS